MLQAMYKNIYSIHIYFSLRGTKFFTGGKQSNCWSTIMAIKDNDGRKKILLKVEFSISYEAQYFLYS